MRPVKPILASLALFLLTASAVAAIDPMAKEETTPPPADGALTVEQIAPLDSSHLQKTDSPPPSSQQ